MAEQSQRLKTPITEEEVKKVIKIIKENFNNRPPSALIIATYDYLQLGKLPSRIQKAKQILIKHDQINGVSEPLYHPKLNRTPKNVRNSEDRFNLPDSALYVGRTNLYRHKNHSNKIRPSRSTESHATCMPPSAKEQKQRILADIFLKEGYGVGIAKKSITFSLNGNLYYSYIRSILYRSFLKVTEVIADDCKINLIDSETYKSYRFKSWLCKCDSWLTKEDMQTFKEFIRSVYDLEANQVTKGDVIQLYKAILTNWFALKYDNPK